ncbi:MAG TPA: class I SAM-dependent methyltransferase [Acidimicrobiia bacterium]|nr:class I SAM-dependent methyltransferase [Acidimicrobiia bacterium]
MGVADVVAAAFGGELPIAVAAFDGSRCGPADAPATLVIRRPDVLSRIVSAPGELGMARAYVAGDVDFEGDIYAVLAVQRSIGSLRIRPRVVVDLVREIGVRHLRPLPPPPEEARLTGPLHSRERDAAAIAHHYDLSNEFYERVLGSSMTYSCAVWESPDVGLDAAQHAKYDLIARKLALRPGMRLLDIGCGWGGMVRHAAREYGVRAVGVTLSNRQADWAAKRVAEDGLSDLVEIRVEDYRDVTDGPYDAVSSIGMYEHVGAKTLPAYLERCRALVRPGGRVLNHGITRPHRGPGAIAPKSFMGRYVFPDGALHEVGSIVSAVHDAGLEVRHVETLREHYALTLRAWVANLERHWDECVELVGEGRARVWRLYMAGSAVQFEQGAIQVHQVLAVRSESGRSTMPLRPDW